MQITFTQAKLESETKIISELIPGQPIEAEGSFIFPLLSPTPSGKLYPLMGLRAAVEIDPSGALKVKVASVRYGAEGAIAEEVPLNGDMIDLRAWAAAVGVPSTNDSEITLSAIAATKTK